MCCWFCGGFVVVCAHLPGLGLSPSHVSSSCVFCVSLRVSLHPSRFSRCGCSLAKPRKKTVCGSAPCRYFFADRQTSSLWVKTPQWIPLKEKHSGFDSTWRYLSWPCFNQMVLQFWYVANPEFSFPDLPSIFVQCRLYWNGTLWSWHLVIGREENMGKSQQLNEDPMVNTWWLIVGTHRDDLFLEETSTRASTTWATARLWPGSPTCLLCTSAEWSDLLYVIVWSFSKKPWMGDDGRRQNRGKSVDCTVHKLRNFQSPTFLHNLPKTICQSAEFSNPSACARTICILLRGCFLVMRLIMSQCGSKPFLGGCTPMLFFAPFWPYSDDFFPCQYIMQKQLYQGNTIYFASRGESCTIRCNFPYTGNAFNATCPSENTQAQRKVGR